MLGSKILEVIIGLVFMYLLFSTLVTLLVEYYITFSRLRSRNMARVIRNALDDYQGGSKLWHFWSKKSEASDDSDQKLSEVFFEHPLIKYLGKRPGRHPSYLSSDKFSKVVLDIIRTKKNFKKLGSNSCLDNDSISKVIEQMNGIEPEENSGDDNDGKSETLRLLTTFAKEASEDIDDFGRRVEGWFDEVGARSQGWFNKRVKWITFFISFVIAAAFNIDSWAVYNRLSDSPELRAQIVANAQEYLQNYDTARINQLKKDIPRPGTTESKELAQYKNAKEKVETFYSESIEANLDVLGIGWSCENQKSWTCWNIVGWLISALAFSLGAPFWFDLLNKLTKLRSSIKAVNSTANQDDSNTENKGAVG